MLALRMLPSWGTAVRNKRNIFGGSMKCRRYNDGIQLANGCAGNGGAQWSLSAIRASIRLTFRGAVAAPFTKTVGAA